MMDPWTKSELDENFVVTAVELFHSALVDCLKSRLNEKIRATRMKKIWNLLKFDAEQVAKHVIPRLL